MKKKALIISALSCTLIIGTLAFIGANQSGLVFSRVKASDEKTITWNKDTGATATTSSGNSLTLGSRYEGEWTFGGDYFASCSGNNTFIDNFTEAESPFQSIKAITVTYTYTDDPLFFSMFLTNDYSQASTSARIDQVESGKKYEVGVYEFDYIYTTAESTFRYFYLNCTSGTINISSLVIEYTCI